MELEHPIFRLALAGDAVGLDLLLTQDPQLINRPDYDGNMPLHLAALSGSAEAVRVCLNALSARTDLDMETEVQRRNFMNSDPLCLAVDSGNIECVHILLEAGSRVDYRYSTEVPVVLATLHGSDINITRLILEAVDADYQRSRGDNYWFAALQPDLSVSLAHYKLMKAHAFPYGIGDFEGLCLNMLEWDPQSNGLEDFLIYLCTDAVDRWFRHKDEVVRGLRRITSFFLRKIVPSTQQLNCVRRLQDVGVYEAPTSARAWLRILQDWGLPPTRITSNLAKKKLLHELSLSGKLADRPPLVEDSGLIPLILYFATVALKFPYPDWLTSWVALCTEAGFPNPQLSTLLELHTIRHSRSASDFFWSEVFTFALSRGIATVDAQQLQLHEAEHQMDVFLDHFCHHCPSMSPASLMPSENLFLNLLSYIQASSLIPAHPLFIHSARKYILPWLPWTLLHVTRPGGLITATVHALSHPALLDAILDFSPPLALFLVSNVNDWPYKAVHENLSRLFDALLLSYSETYFTIGLPDSVEGMLYSPQQHTLTLTYGLRTPGSSLLGWFRSVQTGPQSLLSLTRRTIRMHLRQYLCKTTGPGNPKEPLSSVVERLNLAKSFRHLIISTDLHHTFLSDAAA
ncbi:unnamed protein product [Calicophoron daubneyi]|uniref:Uncharacterized protein n=1 Tax=Calicophoron daubneyi TaxID=300641 RepID=A0AAV2TTB8_CALDB